MRKLKSFLAALVIVGFTGNAFAVGNQLWQGSWTNYTDKAIQLKTNATQCFDPGQFSNQPIIEPGQNIVMKADAVTNGFPICTGGRYWLVVNIVAADDPKTILGQVTMQFLNSANQGCSLVSKEAGSSAPSIYCQSDGTASYTVDIRGLQKYNLHWGLIFPTGKGKSQ